MKIRNNLIPIIGDPELKNYAKKLRFAATFGSPDVPATANVLNLNSRNVTCRLQLKT
jgi:hypothetical protein